jgi:hypothetical protein
MICPDYAKLTGKALRTGLANHADVILNTRSNAGNLRRIRQQPLRCVRVRKAVLFDGVVGQ